MKQLVILISLLSFTACTDSGEVCNGDHCVCTDDTSCSFTCESGAASCHIQSNAAPLDVTCDANGDCHVECSAAASCAVDCGGSTDCNVTCPATGCTVKECVGDACIVTCGESGIATRTGTTATCP